MHSCKQDPKSTYIFVPLQIGQILVPITLIHPTVQLPQPFGWEEGGNNGAEAASRLRCVRFGFLGLNFFPNPRIAGPGDTSFLALPGAMGTRLTVWLLAAIAAVASHPHFLQYEVTYNYTNLALSNINC